MKNIFYSPEKISQFDFVVRKLKLDLEELCRADVAEDEVLEYVETLISQLKRIPACRTEVFTFGLKLDLEAEDKPKNFYESHLALSIDFKEDYPTEEYVLYVLNPTYIALAILSKAYMNYQKVREIEGIENILEDLMKTSITFHLRGTGFDTLDGMFEAMEIFTMSKIHRMFPVLPEISKDFKECYDTNLSKLNKWLYQLDKSDSKMNLSYEERRKLENIVYSFDEEDYKID